MKAPPILPDTLSGFLVIGIALSFVLWYVTYIIAPEIPYHWLHRKIRRDELAPLILSAFLLYTFGVSVLWAVAYLVCWPFLLAGHFRALKQRQAAEDAFREQRAREEEMMARTREEYEAHSRELEIKIYNRRYAERAMQAKRVELEEQVLQAYANHALQTDFFGTASEVDSLRTFGRHLANSGIKDIGLLRDSRNPTISKMVSQAPPLPPVDRRRYLPPPPTHTPVESPFNDPSYNPFLKLNYPIADQKLKPRFHHKLFSLKRT